MEGTQKEQLDNIAKRVVGAAMEVLNELGSGFLEKVYENALAIELQRRGLTVERQAELPVRYKGQEIGVYIADIIVDDSVIIELKCVKAVRREHLAQCLNYLAITRMNLCLLLNFQRPRLEWRRVVNGI